eukprot:scaffold66486_cov17-Tisochrysis_lutea.AAC.3
MAAAFSSRDDLRGSVCAALERMCLQARQQRQPPGQRVHSLRADVPLGEVHYVRCVPLAFLRSGADSAKKGQHEHSCRDDLGRCGCGVHVAPGTDALRGKVHAASECICLQVNNTFFEVISHKADKLGGREEGMGGGEE